MAHTLFPSSHDDNEMIRGLVPVTFKLNRPPAPRRVGDGPATTTILSGQHDDYIWLEYRRAQGLSPESVQEAVTQTLNSTLLEMRNNEAPQEMALEGLEFRVVIVRGSGDSGQSESPREVDLSQFTSNIRAKGTNESLGGLGAYVQRRFFPQNARLGAWVQWGIAQKDPAKFRFVVYPITSSAAIRPGQDQDAAFPDVEILGRQRGQ
ncbi:hypothetical protein PG990_002499 [Apiospora arundinis]